MKDQEQAISKKDLMADAPDLFPGDAGAGSPPYKPGHGSGASEIRDHVVFAPADHKCKNERKEM